MVSTVDILPLDAGIWKETATLARVLSEIINRPIAKE